MILKLQDKLKLIPAIPLDGLTTLGHLENAFMACTDIKFCPSNLISY